MNKNSNQPKVDNSLHWENPRICCTCVHYRENARREPLAIPNLCAVGQNALHPQHPACACYSPKKTKDTI